MVWGVCNMDSENKMIRMGFPPSLFIIGAQKSGTTFLADMLSQHPLIQLARQKEPGYYTRHFDKGLKWYEECFPGNKESILLDASTAYTMAPVGEHATRPVKNSKLLTNVPERINDLSKDARFIYILRCPVLRAYSAYWHNVRAGHEKYSLKEALQINSVYLRTSDYMAQLQEYLKVFPADRIKIIIFEEAVKKPLETYKECCRFIGIPDDLSPIIEKKNSSFVYVGVVQKLNQVLSPIGGLNPLVGMVSKLVPRGVLETFGRLITKKVPKITESEYRYIEEKLHKTTKALEEYLGRNIEVWHR